MDLLLRVPNNLYLSGLMQTRYAPVKSAKLCKFRPTKDVSPGIVNEGESCPIFLWAIHPSVCRHFSANLSSELLELSSDRAITAHTIITHRLFFFFLFPTRWRKRMRMWISQKNEFTMSIYRQLPFKQRSGKSILHFYTADIRLWGMTCCALTQRTCPEASVADSYGLIE